MLRLLLRLRARLLRRLDVVRARAVLRRGEVVHLLAGIRVGRVPSLRSEARLVIEFERVILRKGKCRQRQRQTSRTSSCGYKGPHDEVGEHAPVSLPPTGKWPGPSPVPSSARLAAAVHFPSTTLADSAVAARCSAGNRSGLVGDHRLSEGLACSVVVASSDPTLPAQGNRLV